MSQPPQPDPTTPDPITIEKRGTILIVTPQMSTIEDDELGTLAGAIDQATGPEAGIKLVILDLSRVRSIPSMALGLFVHLANTCKSRQQKLKLAALQPQVRQVFAITQLDRVFVLAPSVEAALQ
jgi:anti-sigma B factor antagonist